MVMNNREFDAWVGGFFDDEGTFWHTKAGSISIAIVQGLHPQRPVRYLFRRLKKKYGYVTNEN